MYYVKLSVLEALIEILREKKKSVLRHHCVTQNNILLCKNLLLSS